MLLEMVGIAVEPQYQDHGWTYASGFDQITGFVNEVSCCPDSDGDGVPGCPTYDFISQQFYNSPDCDDGDIHIKGGCINHHIVSVKVLSNDSRVQWAFRQQKSAEELSILDMINLEIFWENKYGLIPGLIKLYVGLLNQTTGSIEYGKHSLPITLFGGNASASIIPFSFWDIRIANEDMIRTVDELGYLPLRLMPHLVFNGEVYNKSFFDYNLPLTNCYHVSGDGKHSIAFMRGNSSELTPQELIVHSIDIKETEFERVDPFYNYKNYFSYYADLKNFNDNTFKKYSNGYFTSETKIREIKEGSSCKNMEKYVFMSDINIKRGSKWVGGYTTKNSPIIIVQRGPPKTSLPYFTFTLLHEMGHAFCGLADEYLYSDFGRLPSPFTNCVPEPTEAYKYGGILYGKTNIVGCTYDHYYIGSPKEGHVINYYRPIETSIMRESQHEERFNVISCGYCLASIKGGNPKSYFKECNNLNTIKT